MRLDDQLEIMSSGETVAAYVFHRGTASAPVEDDGQHLFFDYRQTLVAIVEPGDYAPNQELRWRGRRYEIGNVAVRVLRGEDHHVTLTLETP